MSYDLDHITASCPCPCGKGKIVCGSGTNDWNQVREGMIEIWCSDCYKKYKLVSGGLLPIDYPEYSGDIEAFKKMNVLRDIVDNYRHPLIGSRYWSKELKQYRLSQYMTPEEICVDPEQFRKNRMIAFYYAKLLANDYSLCDLQEAELDIQAHKYSTELSGISRSLVERHKRQYKTVKLSNVIVPIRVAIRNYDAYKQADKEDAAYVEQKKQELTEVSSIYYKDYNAYEIERKKHLITYELKENS